MRSTLFVLMMMFSLISKGEMTDSIYVDHIKTVRLHMNNNQQGYPVYRLGSSDKLVLSFDDMQSDIKNYYYSFVLCDYNWNPVNLNPFDYLKGFTQNRISTYRYSSIALTRYTYYEAIIPDNSTVPTASGNYIVKVFLDGDTSKLVLTRRMLVVDQKATVTGEVVQPQSPKWFNTHQKIRFSVLLKGVNSFSAAQQVKVVILQNNRWDNAMKGIPPTFVRGQSLEYNSENIGIFPAGKEWRWLDLRSLRLQSDRIDSGAYHKNSTDMYMKVDVDRSAHRYVYFADLNGNYWVTTYETINPNWQGDYATVQFKLQAPNGNPYPDKDVYLVGKFTDFSLSDQWKMQYDEESGLYTLKTLLKQGYYNYIYITKQKDNGQLGDLEGNYWETENSYTILVYYKGFSDRHDQLIGMGQINSRSDRPGFSF
jgi:hypothetical protein